MRERVNNIIVVLSLSMVLFHLYTAFWGTLPAVQQRAIHLGFGLLLAALYSLKDAENWMRKAINVFRVVATVIVISYILGNFHNIMERFGSPSTADVVMGVTLIILALDLSRRMVGITMTSIAVVFLLYAFAGHLLPGILWHRGYDLERIVSQISLGMEGIFGIPLGVSAKYVYLFVIFGALLEVTGIGQFYIDVAIRAVGESAGGPAKVAVIASSCMGTISGSAVANVVGTGSITIPMMKSLGYRSAFAGAVEAVASTGGQIMPPMMGAGAYIMAEILGVPFRTVILAAFLPSVIFYCAVFVMVHFTAKVNNLVGIDVSSLPPLSEMFKKRGICIAPLVILVVMLVFMQVSIMKAAVWCVFVTILVGLYISRHDVKAYLIGLKDACVSGSRTALIIVATTSCAGIVIAIINLTGIGMKFTSVVLALAGGNLFLVLFFIMLASIIIGMGLPTTSAYLLLAVLAAPTLTRLGVVPIAAHMFIFYFGCLSVITPPVALAVYAACSLAKSDFWETAIEACKLASVAFFVPYIFVYDPVLVWQGSLLHIAIAAVTAVLGAVAIGAGISGWLYGPINILKRIVLFAGGFLMIFPGFYPSLSGFVLVASIYLIERRKVI